MTSDIQAEIAYADYLASRADPDCCEICGGWLSEGERWPTGRAHRGCVEEVLREWLFDGGFGDDDEPKHQDCGPLCPIHGDPRDTSMGALP
jgi:hypothetical protein